jgi:hypothetical protein
MLGHIDATKDRLAPLRGKPPLRGKDPLRGKRPLWCERPLSGKPPLQAEANFRIGGDPSADALLALVPRPGGG